MPSPHNLDFSIWPHAIGFLSATEDTKDLDLKDANELCGNFTFSTPHNCICYGFIKVTKQCTFVHKAVHSSI